MKSPLVVTFLGTGTSQGVPVIGSDHPVCKSVDPRDKRLRVSVMIEWDETRVIIDCGPDFRQQMLRENIDRIDAIFLTHEHSDHTAGIDDIRPYYFRQGNIPFYALDRVFESLHDRFKYIFDEENKYPGAPTIEEFVIHKDMDFQFGGQTVIPVEVLHNGLPILGFRIGEFTYLTDVKTIEHDEMNKIRNCKTVVINALREAPHESHFNLEEALSFIEEIKPERAYLTHISHLLGFHKEVQEKLPSNVFLAYDGLKLTI